MATLTWLEQFGIERVPHVIGPQNTDGMVTTVDEEDQIDGQAHVILAWALLAIARPDDPFVAKTYDYVFPGKENGEKTCFAVG